MAALAFSEEEDSGYNLTWRSTSLASVARRCAIKPRSGTISGSGEHLSADQTLRITGEEDLGEQFGDFAAQFAYKLG